jgi:hypothetical protein
MSCRAGRVRSSEWLGILLILPDGFLREKEKVVYQAKDLNDTGTCHILDEFMVERVANETEHAPEH